MTRPTPPTKNNNPRILPKKLAGAIRNIPTIIPKIPINIDHKVTVCYQSNTINVHDNKESIFEFSIRLSLKNHMVVMTRLLKTTSENEFDDDKLFTVNRTVPSLKVLSITV